ncbi:Cys-tRNA(Pro) deacylase [Isoptericola cucumis]|uniref:Cys-tRNA(Pro)/Cys-tRNA(Cys) deacylase n=1 Tax=Isoptericola cucumis TaxID=1776856 RepID=A0ABQ2B220_9MICO|nr:Cys-tRNA(Pro) deacylase [Isoptericola cucumis]GGI05974.1 Cys-tRNA(Pro)/Cys-tRNA(Cys) deacylase [Isoptericola cucumis]
MAKKDAARRTTHGTPAVVALDRAGVPYELHAYTHDAASGLSYGLGAAAAIGADPAHVFKTLMAEVDGALVVAVVPVDRSLDLKALARAVGGKRATMADPGAAQRATGYVVGGISPLGQKHRHPTVLDATADALDRVYVSGGRRGLDVALAPADLLRLTDGRTAPIAR